MKINWGHSIIIVYALFVGGILLLALRSSQQKFDLVKSDYYGAEFTCIGDLIAHIMVSGMDPDYEITKDGKSIGEKAIDYISF